MAQEFEIKNQSEWKKIVPDNAQVRRLADGLRFVEGPVWTDQDGGYLLFSDTPANRIYKYSLNEGLSVFREPADSPNGQARDAAGRLITCHHGTRSITRTDPDGSIHIIADRYNGKRLNSPNDVVVKRDGTIWFTDPPYGLPHGKEGKELDKNYVFKLDPQSGRLTVVADDFVMPNGLCFSPDESRLYIADSEQKVAHIRVFDVGDDNTLSGGKLFCKIDNGVPDGFRVDTEGRIYTSAGDGVHIYATDGQLIGKILMPKISDPKNPDKTITESPANVCFGGPDNRTLFITARTGLYSVDLNVAGTPLAWQRGQ